MDGSILGSFSYGNNDNATNDEETMRGAFHGAACICEL